MSEAGDPDQPTGGLCPICGRPALKAFRPFCSKRCADVDLGRWLNGVYSVASEEPGEPEEPKD